MAASLRTRVSGFHFVNGVGKEGAPRSLVVQKGPDIPAKSKSTKGNLYVLVEIMNDPTDADALATKLAGLIQKTYFGTHGSTTTSLRAAIQAANQFLLDENLKAPYEAQRDSSVCCLVLRGSDAIIARSGPIAAYHIRGTRWDRYPSLDLDASPPTASIPLGLRKEPEIGFHHTELTPGDTMMLIESRGDQALSHTEFDGPPEAAVTAMLRSAGQRADFSTLLVEISGEQADFMPPPAPEGKKARPEVEEEPTPLPAAQQSPRPARAERRKTERAEDEEEPRGPRFSRLALVLALITPLLVIGGVFGYNWYQQQQAERAFLASLTQAKESYVTARTTSDKAIAQTALAEAQSHLADAVRISPEDEQALQLQRDLQLLDDELRLVTPLYFVPELYRFSDASSEPARLVVNGSDIYVLDKRNSTVTRHVMNEVGDGLERGEEVIKIVEKGQQVGNTVVGNIVDLTWMPAGGEREQDSLLIIDASGHLISYSEKAGLQAQALPGREGLQAPSLIDSFSGARLYILDAGNNQIFRYVATADGYTLDPELYFPDDVQVNLSGVRDMSIDGDVWLLFPDHIDRYQAGQPITFEIQDLDQPFSSPAGLFAASQESSTAMSGLYVADTGNGRIVKLSREGELVRQYRPRDGRHFYELRDLYVDAGNGKIYFLSGSSLYMADVPQGE